jgi:hypothetical protein
MREKATQLIGKATQVGWKGAESTQLFGQSNPARTGTNSTLGPEQLKSEVSPTQGSPINTGAGERAGISPHFSLAVAVATPTPKTQDAPKDERKGCEEGREGNKEHLEG